ncbi:MAG: endonuclease/exonuclease/phosphatase family protein [Prevotella sp.]|jgi:endonuclease/exonuclease/phosphatase family metal-dependent hydrolase|nr:endonuclease/exonuclease/phosphatase family protein [Prevotella sp.]
MKKILFGLAFFCLCPFIFAQTLNVATYNVRNDNQGDAKQGNGWIQRCPVIANLITYNDFDIWGSQEVKHNQLLDLLDALPQYSYVGVGRDDGKTVGEYAPIFFKKDKYKVLKSGHFWMAEKTDEPNKGWDAALPRICTWVQLKEKKGKLKFWFFNLHMDHVGVLARRESAKLVLEKIKEMCGKDPVILTGDFNVDQHHQSYTLLSTSGILTDSYERADVRYALNGTFNAFKPDLLTNSRIDHIFVSPSLYVERYGVLTDTYRTPRDGENNIKAGDFPKEYSFEGCDIRLPSDHFPVCVKLVYKKKKK